MGTPDGPRPAPHAGARALLLVGAGHAHLHLVRHAAALTSAGYRVTLLAPRWFHYSGVASATAAGGLPVEAGRIDVAELAVRSGVEHHVDELTSLDRVRKVAGTALGGVLAYDVLSLNVGSALAPPPSLQVADDVLRVKPLGRLAALGERVDAAAAQRGSGARVTVVGGGNSGLELAGNLSVRRGVAAVRLVEAADELGGGLPPGARRRVRRVLESRGVEVRTGCPATRLSSRLVRCADGSETEHDVAVLATGLAAAPLVAGLGLGDERGVPVRATLQHELDDDVYAAGDCAHFLPQPLPWIGVHGVRQGPVLHRSLLARAAGDPLPAYHPQRRALAVLDLGGGTGLAVRGRLWWQGRSALALKRRIDERWLAGYQSPA